MDFRFRGKSGQAAGIGAMSEFDPEPDLIGFKCVHRLFFSSFDPSS